jgi:RHS repeat-associated protein
MKYQFMHIFLPAGSTRQHTLDTVVFLGMKRYLAIVFLICLPVLPFAQANCTGLQVTLINGGTITPSYEGLLDNGLVLNDVTFTGVAPGGVCVASGQYLGGGDVWTGDPGSTTSVTIPSGASCSYAITITIYPGGTNSGDGDDGSRCKKGSSSCSTCQAPPGMPVWQVSEPYISLWLRDEPLGYQPAIGPRISFNLSYKQREASAGLNRNIFSIGKKWNCSWLSYITVDQYLNESVHFANGMQRFYNSASDYLSNTRLAGNDNTGFTISYPDGSRDVYGFVVTNNNRLRNSLTLQAPNTTAWSQSYGYDNARRLKTISSPAGAFGYAYDSVKLQRVDILTLPNGSYITNTYDSVAREVTTKLVNSSAAVLDAEGYLYNTASQRTAETNTAGDYRNYTYDNVGELKTAIGKEASGTTNRWQEQLGYAYDAAGNLNYRTNYTLVQSFGVNNLNELITTTNTGKLTVAGTTTSPATNVTVNTVNAVLYADTMFASTNQSWVNGNNTFTAIAKDVYGRINTNAITVNIQLTNSYSYDSNGNLLSDGTRNFAYDDENQLTSAWVASVWSNSFVYDGKMRKRIERDYTYDGSSWTLANEVHYIYDGNVVIQERDVNNLPKVTYTRGNDLSGSLQGAGGIGGLLARSDNSQMVIGSASAHAYYYADGNGNITMLINNLQSIVAKYLYDPFGNTLSLSGPLANANTYRFSSKEWNDNAGLYYYLYRFYDPNLQRWPNRDPIAEVGFEVLRGKNPSHGEDSNLYEFLYNDPLYSYDPYGLSGLPSSGFKCGNDSLSTGSKLLCEYCPWAKAIIVAGVCTTCERACDVWCEDKYGGDGTAIGEKRNKLCHWDCQRRQFKCVHSGCEVSFN